MATCTNCGEELAADDDFCSFCGRARQRVSAPEPPWIPSGSAGPLVAPVPPPPPPPTRDFVLDGGRTGAATTSTQFVAQAVGSRDSLLGQAAPNSTYLGYRTQYEKEDALEELDPLKSTRYLLETLKHAAIVWLVWVIGMIPIAIVCLILTVVAHKLGVILWFLFDFLWWLTMGIVFWFSKLPGQLSEWKYLIDDKGRAAPMVFDHIAWSFQRRQTPMDDRSRRRFAIPGQEARELLELRQGTFYGLVSCFAYGEDLYIGWTFWLYLSPFRLFLIAVRRFLWTLRLRGNAMYVSVEFDRAKAFREAIHGAVREGVDVAAGQIHAQGRGMFESTFRLVDGAGMGSAPWSAVG